jgi:hypothetical protein
MVKEIIRQAPDRTDLVSKNVEKRNFKKSLERKS